MVTAWILFIALVLFLLALDLGVFLTFSPFLDPSGMLGFLPLASPERVGFSDGK